MPKDALTPQARHHFTGYDQVDALVVARDAEPDVGFMGWAVALCSLPRSNPGNQSLLFQQLPAHSFKEDLIGGAVFASVTKKEFLAQTILVPPEVLRWAFEEMTVPCDKQLRLPHRQNQNLRVAGDLLLPRLMSGEIAA